MRSSIPFETLTGEVHLEKLRLYKECDVANGHHIESRYYLEATYILENDEEIRKIVYPKIALPVLPNRFPDISHEVSLFFGAEKADIDLGFGTLPLSLSRYEGHNVFCYSKRLKEKNKRYDLGRNRKETWS